MAKVRSGCIVPRSVHLLFHEPPLEAALLTWGEAVPPDYDDVPGVYAVVWPQRRELHLSCTPSLRTVLAEDGDWSAVLAVCSLPRDLLHDSSERAALKSLLGAWLAKHTPDISVTGLSSEEDLALRPEARLSSLPNQIVRGLELLALLTSNDPVNVLYEAPKPWDSPPKTADLPDTALVGMPPLTAGGRWERSADLPGVQFVWSPDALGRFVTEQSGQWTWRELPPTRFRDADVWVWRNGRPERQFVPPTATPSRAVDQKQDAAAGSVLRLDIHRRQVRPQFEDE